ncbi:MAG: phosphoribosylanthranilate isomerase [Candidatus Poribacteria bacterium]|nr:MAG: phosphoribosylanthranilate isomerase [Candidatus Poribacteria bacterium]
MNYWPFSGEVKPIIGVVHLKPLPGSPRWDGDWTGLLSAAVRDAQAMVAKGIDGLIVENFGDVPFYGDSVPPITIAAMTRVVLAVRERIGPTIPIGINVLRNDALAALSIAAATGAQFIRVNVHVGAMVTDQGVLSGRAAETLRERARLGTPVAIFADVLVKHASPLGAGVRLLEAAEETAFRGLADALIFTGTATGRPAPLDEVRQVRDHLRGEVPILVGSGVVAQTIAETLTVADGVIVGTALKRGGRTAAAVDPERVRELIAQAEPFRRRQGPNTKRGIER